MNNFAIHVLTHMNSANVNLLKNFPKRGDGDYIFMKNNFKIKIIEKIIGLN